MAASASLSAGPLPSPEVLERYERLIPGSADQIIRMAERQMEHRQEMEKKVVDANIERSRHGLWVGGSLAAIVVVGGLITVMLGHDWAGTVVITGTVIGLATTFAAGTTSRKKELANKEQAVTKK